MIETQMSGPRSPRQPEWQANRVPKLSYRKPLPQDELDKLTYSPREPVIQSTPIIKTASVYDTTARSTVPVAVSALTNNKKKNTFLSGFFSKEPTISALAQVEADLTAKHGAANPQAVPHVSSRRMPEHVPKVNARWDGIPETVRTREREEKQRKRLSQRSGIAPHYVLHSQSSDGSLRATMQTGRSSSRRESDVASATDSWASRNDQLTNLQRPESFSSASSSNDSREADIRRAASTKSQSLRSPSGSSLPEITSLFPHHQKQAKAVEKEYYTTHIDAIPEHSSSPVLTPREVSPATPIYSAGKEVTSRSRGADAESIGARTTSRSLKRTTHVPMDAFLAGEAHPLELEDDVATTTESPSLPLRRAKQDDSTETRSKATSNLHGSREQSDTRTRPVIRSEAAPWEFQGPPVSGSAISTARSRATKVLARPK